MRIKNQFLLAAIIIFSLFLTSCFDLGFYSAQFPMADAKKSVIDKQLLGTWEQVQRSDAKSSDQKNTFEVIRFNDRELVFKAYNNSDNNIIRAYTVYVRGIPFLNMQNIKEDREYIFGRYTVTGDSVLTIEFVSSKLFKDKSIKNPKELYKFIRSNLKNKDLFDPEIAFSFKKQLQ